MAVTIVPPMAPFCDAQGAPLQGGYVYVGDRNQPAAVRIYYGDGKMGGVVPTPLRTVNGYLVYNGRRVSARYDGDETEVAVTVLDSNMRVICENVPVSNVP